MKKHFHIYSESWKEIVVTVGGETYMEFYSPLVPYVFPFVFYNILKKGATSLFKAISITDL